MLLCQVREDGPLWDRWSSFCCDAYGASSYKAKWIVVPDGQGGTRRVSTLPSSPRLAHALLHHPFAPLSADAGRVGTAGLAVLRGDGSHYTCGVLRGCRQELHNRTQLYGA